MVLLGGLLFAGCLEIEVQGTSSPTPPTSSPPTTNPGIAPGEPNPGLPRTGFRDLLSGEWCYYEQRDFEGRVFGSFAALESTWNDYIACHPDTSRHGFPAIDWENEFVVALLAPVSGCVGAQLNVTHASAHNGRYLVQWDHDENRDAACATALSRPIVFIAIDREYGDKLDVDFVEVEQD
jgi:hypothetical protein